MGKNAKRYLDVDPWIIREGGFHADRAEVSESIFSLANEFAGVRGAFDEGYSGPAMPGFYFNGIYESGEHKYSTKFKGFAERWTYMVNAVDWLYTRIALDGEQLDLAKCRFGDFVRQVDMRRGILERSFTWETLSGKKLRLIFERFLSMADQRTGVQRIRLQPINFSGDVELTCGLDFGTLYHLRGTRPWSLERQDARDGWMAALGCTASSGHRVFASFRLNREGEAFAEGQLIGQRLRLKVTPEEETVVEKLVVFHTEKNTALELDTVWDTGLSECTARQSLSVIDATASHMAYWADVWNHLDLVIEGDDENQQGFRYCIFHLHQTYHGADARFNVGAKGLTGEHYWGVTWWDTETYCLPFYLFNNRRAAKNLIEYRYRTLDGARARAGDFHLPGARYPMCTIDGEEVCDVWQHGDLEIHVSAAVAYGVWKYAHITKDESFLFEKGAEMLVEISRFYAARGGWGQQTGKFGFWGVMGADEMHTMVNNNAYTNFMARKSLEWTLRTLDEMERLQPERFRQLAARTGLKDEERMDWRLKAGAMEDMWDEGSGLYEQHEGFFNLPHIDYSMIPDEQFPVQKKWPYVDLFRFDLIKQPDVLLFFFLFANEFDRESLRRNFDYYEPRCSHESSLSPAVHSILAARLGDLDKAFNYAHYASRLDLDDYNNNTSEGLHVTSMAGTWMNLVYGFGGLESDGPCLRFSPSCPPSWRSFSFRLVVGEEMLLQVEISPTTVRFTLLEGNSFSIEVYGQPVTVTREGVAFPIPALSLEAVIFDLDGVIVSTDECHYRAWKRMAGEEGIDFNAADNERCRGVSRMESLDVVLEKSSRSYTLAEKECLATRKNEYYGELLASIGPADILPGVMEFIDDLRTAGIKIAIGSSSRNARKILQQIGLLKDFDAVVGGNDIERSKPAPDVFLKAAEKLGAPPACCLVVEDAAAGVEAAVAAGMRCLAVGSAADHPSAHYRARGLHAVRPANLGFHTT
ncbi:MAG: beta-phosphoglucomutase [Terrimicrobiaceae bacterium]